MRRAGPAVLLSPPFLAGLGFSVGALLGSLRHGRYAFRVADQILPLSIRQGADRLGQRLGDRFIFGAHDLTPSTIVFVIIIYLIKIFVKHFLLFL